MTSPTPKSSNYVPIKEANSRLRESLILNLSESQILEIVNKVPVNSMRVKGELFIDLNHFTESLPTFNVTAAQKLRDSKREARKKSKLYQEIVLFCLKRCADLSQSKNPEGEKILAAFKTEM